MDAGTARGKKTFEGRIPIARPFEQSVIITAKCVFAIKTGCGAMKHCREAMKKPAVPAWAP
jgi:hypothetical protein